jgi:hypothetical protein
MALGTLTRRARLLSDGIILSLGGGMCATLLLAIRFASQFFGLRHAYGAAVLFITATLLLGAGSYPASRHSSLSPAYKPSAFGKLLVNFPRWHFCDMSARPRCGRYRGKADVTRTSRFRSD